MLYRAIYFFFISAIFTKTFSLDLYSFLFILSLSFIIFLYNYKRHFLEFVFYGSFCFLGFYLVFTNPKIVSPLLYDKEYLEFTGKVVSLEEGLYSQKIVLEVVEMKVPSPTKKTYAEIERHMFQKFNVYEMYKIEGYTYPDTKYLVSEKPKLFLKNETEKLNYNVSFKMKHDFFLEKLGYKKTFIENLHGHILSFSNFIKDNLKRHFNEPYATIITGVSLGDTSGFVKDVKDIFINSGLIHLMVLSGTNMSFMVLLLWFLFAKFPVKERTIFTIFLSWFFVFLTGLNPPATRAAIMATFLLLGNLWGRTTTVLNSLFLALFLLSVYDINSLFYNPSLHLSFLAAFALFIMSPIFYDFIKNKFQEKIYYSNVLNIFLSISFSIFLTTCPYILGLVGVFGTGGIVLTFLAEPITFLIMIFSFIIIFLNFISFVLSFVKLNFLSDILIFIFAKLNIFFAKIFLLLAEIGAEYFPKINFSLSKNFLIFYFLILISLFIYLHNKNKN